jgi:tRNA G18 (ribose-2'-O)-methylase SpoU
MPIIMLEHLDDPRVASYQHIHEPDLVRRQGRFVAEGRLVVERLIECALDAGQYVIESLLISDAALAGLQPQLARLGDVPTYVCRAAAFRQLAGLNLHRGCLALARRPAERCVTQVTRDARTLVVLEAIGNPDNVGGIFRNAAAFGVDAVLLSPGCADPLYRKAIRTSMAASLRVPFAVIAPWPDGLRDLRASGVALVALTPQPAAEPLESVAGRRRPERTALLFGAEGPGLTAEALAHADLRVRIPMTTAVDSLNVAVACGIVLSRLSPVVSELAR